ncbi:MAG TPA: sigma-70 family RNA polymerase sigma factor [Acidimicrobiales bacterium]|nr:sigma-70 family RNA polymerase sigma factor [Acidimicrobiales bacterium]
MRQRGQAVRPTQGRVGQDETDADLAVRAGAGDIPAFDELYRRHSQAAWRVAQAVTGNPHDAADAVSDAFTRVFQALPNRLQGGENFRPYLLASVRNASIDVLRRSGRTTPSDQEDVLDSAAVGREPSDLVLADVDSDMVAAAFRALPERWRTVLWLTEVEDMPPREVAVLLGISANGVAQLAVRARAGLRERFLQAHLQQGVVRKECRATVANLGAYAAGGLPPRDISKVDQHLAGCEACRDRVGELEDLSQTLHRAVPPIPAFLATAVMGKWLAASQAGKIAGAGGAAAGAGAGAAKMGAGAGAAKSAGAGAMAAKAGAGAGAAAAAGTAGGTASLAVASAALFAASLLGVNAVDTAKRAERSRQGSEPLPTLSSVSPEEVAGTLPDPLADYPVAGVEVPDSDTLILASPDTSGVAAPDVGAPATPDTTTPTVPTVEPLAQLGMWLPGPLAVVLALGESTAVCPGVQVGTLALGCVPDQGKEPAITLSTEGTALPEEEITIPLPAGTPAPAPPVRGQSSVRSDATSGPPPDAAEPPRRRR